MRSTLPLLLLASCVSSPNSGSSSLVDGGAAASAGRAPAESIPFKKFVLENGLELVVHEDHSDPVVAVYVYYHVGSAREVKGRSGFAHLFEHMLFQGSQNVGDDQHFKLVQEAGGSVNGSTTADRTNYYEVLPSNQLELALWLEADRMGFFLPALTQAKLDNQRDVVKNERRQNYENRPYGQADGCIQAALHPADHPYSWLTIGTQEDLGAASLDDVQAFFRRWYGPNNATIAVGGDVDTDEVVRLVHQYFGAIPRGPDVEAAPAPRPTSLTAEKRLILEDKVKLPELSFTWPAVPARTADAPALDLLATLLAANKSAILEKALMIDEQLAKEVRADNEAREIAGSFSISVRPHPGVSLDTLEKRTLALLEGFARDGVDPRHLERAKSRYEASMVRWQETVAQRTATLADNNTFTRDPGFLDEDIRRHLAVSPADVRRVLETYVLGKHAVVLSVVPEGQRELAASGSTLDAQSLPPAVEVAWKGQSGPKIAAAPATRIPGPVPSVDRTKAPGPGRELAFRAPRIWRGELEGGIRAIGTAYDELPMTTLALSLPAGRLYETTSTLGLASMTAEMLQQGTRSLSATSFTEELDRLGANLSVRTSDEEMTFTLSCLDKHLEEAVALLGDVIHHPRFAEEDFRRIQKDRLVELETRGDQIRVIASDAFRRLLWGDGVAGLPNVGTRATIEKLTLEQVRSFWADHGLPSGARLAFVGAEDAKAVKKLLSPVTAGWEPRIAAKRLEPPSPVRIAETKLFLVDKPGAAQSEIRIGHVSLASTDPDFYPLIVLNEPLGGQFSSRVNLNLREVKGYTYGARTGLEGGLLVPGAFVASAAVKTDVTKESVSEFMKELAKIREGITEKELAFAKDSLSRSATRQYESTWALLGMLENVSRYGWPDDYPERRLKQLAGFEVEDLNGMATKHIRPDAMVLLVVGDKQKVGAGLAELGYGEPIELDIDGQRLVPQGASN